MFTTLGKYWPAIVAGLYLAYVVAAGQTANVGPALSAFLVALGLNASATSAHAKIEALR
jgi:hypothetical protein